MKTRIKKWGDSCIITLSPEVLQYHDLKLGDWVDISDIIKVKKPNKLNSN